MGWGGSFTAVQGEGEQYSCIRRASSVTLTICFQFCKVKLDQSATEYLFRLFFLIIGICGAFYYLWKHISRLAKKKFVNKIFDFIAIKYYIRFYHIFKRMMEI